jgi:hypothetical protein
MRDRGLSNDQIGDGRPALEFRVDLRQGHPGRHRQPAKKVRLLRAHFPPEMREGPVPGPDFHQRTEQVEHDDIDIV